ncbi:keratin-associated protein 4-6-like [Maniola jurtina]|uniref:keratin-associated protein 4-6-like n=1 Tax=Maniola jurtina TaxID=191418 RepID=UPI001E68D96E|nr:keratin-associated protein 4-6-like [Maniola jurtina]
MTRYFVITFIAATSIFLISSTKATCGSCGPNEVEREQTDCTSDCCPEPADQPSACPDPCASPCKCDVMYLRAPNGTCIRGRDCPSIPCGKNEQFDICPVCSEQCSNASPDGRRCRTVGRIGVTVICRPACRCIDQYWRNDKNECVCYDECPICGPNEVEREQTDCTSDCCPEPADQPSACPDPCASPCKCGFNFLRSADGTCIRSSDCPSIPCGENEQFDPCPVTSSPFCSEQCSKASPDGQRCRVVGRIGITVPCRPACRCIDNYWRSNYTNKCVPYDKCSQSQTTCD